MFRVEEVSTMRMEASGFSELLVFIYQRAWTRIPKDCNHKSHCFDSLVSHILCLLQSFEKVLVQNIQFGLSPSLSEAIRSIPRWRLIQASFPHVVHCAASLLHNRYVLLSLQNGWSTSYLNIPFSHSMLHTEGLQCSIYFKYKGCPTSYQTRHFFNNPNTNDDIATKFEQEYVRCMRNVTTS
jgi:hypothetical protein